MSQFVMFYCNVWRYNLHSEDRYYYRDYVMMQHFEIIDSFDLTLIT